MTTEPLRAAIFDLGGVVLGSPLEGIAEYEAEHGIPSGYVNVSIVTMGSRGAFQRLERGELSLQDFYKAFQDELALPSQLNAYQEYLKRKGRPALPASTTPPIIDTVALFDAMMQKSSKINRDMVQALLILRCLGLKVAALTNNWNMPSPNGEPSNSSSTHEVSPYFDMVIESCVVGLRKPDPRIYELAASELGVDYNQIVFLDDIGINLKSASKLGIETIRVEIGKVQIAIAKLEAIVRERCNPNKYLGPYHNLPSLSVAASKVTRTYHIPVHLDVPDQLVATSICGSANNPPFIVLGQPNADVSAAVSWIAKHFSCIAIGFHVTPSLKHEHVAAVLGRLGFLKRAALVISICDSEQVVQLSQFLCKEHDVSIIDEPCRVQALMGLEQNATLDRQLVSHRVSQAVKLANPLSDEYSVTESRL